MQDALRRLRLDKRDALKQLIEVKREQIRDGRAQGTLDGAAVATLTQELLSLEYEFAQTRAERIAVREKMVREAKTQEDIARSNIDSGVAPQWSLIEARLKRLDYQIMLEEEKAKKA